MDARSQILSVTTSMQLGTHCQVTVHWFVQGKEIFQEHD